MKYLMLVCRDAEKINTRTEPDAADPSEDESFPWLDDVRARGIWVTGDQLAPPRRARSARVLDAKTIVTDGPFSETKEAVRGFDIFECDSLEEAVEIAAAHPVAQSGTIEVRPFWGKVSAVAVAIKRTGLRALCRPERAFARGLVVVDDRSLEAPPAPAVPKPFVERRPHPRRGLVRGDALTRAVTALFGVRIDAVSTAPRARR